jgi:hypothetical protein
MKDCCPLYLLLSTVFWYLELIAAPHPVDDTSSLSQGIGSDVVVEAGLPEIHQAHFLEIPVVEWEMGPPPKKKNCDPVGLNNNNHHHNHNNSQVPNTNDRDS